MVKIAFAILLLVYDITQEGFPSQAAFAPFQRGERLSSPLLKGGFLDRIQSDFDVSPRPLTRNALFSYVSTL